MCAGDVKTRAESNTRGGDLLTIKSRHFRHLTSEAVRQQKLKSWTNEIEERSKATISSMHSNHTEYTKHRLCYFNDKQTVYEKFKIARHKFDKYRRTE